MIGIKCLRSTLAKPRESLNVIVRTLLRVDQAGALGIGVDCEMKIKALI